MGKKVSQSSRRWLDEHFSDKYVQEAQAAGWRSRAAFKLAEIDERDRLLKPGMTVLDLGAAPGGWTQYAGKRMAGRGVMIATDILAMAELPDVHFIQGDFTEQSTYEQLLACCEQQAGKSGIDLVLSDMAPNMTGNKAVDQPRSMALVELAVDFARQVLNPGGDLLVKVFQGAGFEALMRETQQSFDKLQFRKPDASRGRSREQYLLARGFRP